MESLGLAANILQFVEFTAKLVHITNELRHAASTSENKGYAAIVEHLKVIADFEASAQAIHGASTAVPPEDKVSLPEAPFHLRNLTLPPPPLPTIFSFLSYSEERDRSTHIHVRRLSC